MVESVFSIVILMFLVLGVVEVAFALYARNVIAASAHEGARAAIERGRDLSEAQRIAVETVRGSAGGLVDDLGVDVSTTTIGERASVTVTVSGRVEPVGPIPFPMHLEARATASREVEVP